MGRPALARAPNNPPPPHNTSGSLSNSLGASPERWCRLPPFCHQTNKQYEVGYQEYYEPYVLVAKSEVPPYDERFTGYGLNKIAHLYHLNQVRAGPRLPLLGAPVMLWASDLREEIPPRPLRVQQTHCT